jgi:hypothetical protein
VDIPAGVVPFVQDILRGRAAAWPDIDPATCGRAAQALDAHGILPLLHDARRSGLAQGVPEAMAATWAGAYMSSAALGAVWRRERASVIEGLDAAGLRPVALKGAALLGTVYKNVALRSMGDLDILLGDGDLDGADAVMRDLGYATVLTEAEAYEHHRAYSRRGPGGLDVMVELHRRLFASPPYDRLLPTSDLVARATTMRADGLDLAVLDPCDFVLHLAGHLVLQHPCFERLIWVADIDRVLRHPQGTPDWSDLVRRSRQAWLLHALSDSLRLCRMWFDTPVPEPVWQEMALRPPTRDEEAAYARLRARAPIGREGARLWSDVQGIPGLRNRIRFAAAHLFPSPAYIREWYGLDSNWKVPACYVRRMLRGAGHIVRRGAPGPVVGDRPEAWMIER